MTSTNMNIIKTMANNVRINMIDTWSKFYLNNSRYTYQETGLTKVKVMNLGHILQRRTLTSPVDRAR